MRRSRTKEKILRNSRSRAVDECEALLTEFRDSGEVLFLVRIPLQNWDYSIYSWGGSRFLNQFAKFRPFPMRSWGHSFQTLMLSPSCSAPLQGDPLLCFSPESMQVMGKVLCRFCCRKHSCLSYMVLNTMRSPYLVDYKSMVTFVTKVIDSEYFT